MRHRSWAASFVMTFALLGAANAANTDPGVLDIAEIDRLIERSVQERHLVGLSVGVMHQGFVYINQGGFEAHRPTTFAGLVETFREYQG